MHLRGIVTCGFRFLLLTNLSHFNQHIPHRTAQPLCVIKYSAQVRKSMPLSFQTNPQLRASKGCNEEAHPRTCIYCRRKISKKEFDKRCFYEKGRLVSSESC